MMIKIMALLLIGSVGTTHSETIDRAIDNARSFPHYERLEDSPEREILNSMDEAQLLLYRANSERFVVTVFSDLFCPYCRDFHKEIDHLLKNGITVRYGLFPLTSNSTPLLISIWCSDDPKLHFDVGMLEFKTANLYCQKGEEILNQNRQWAKALNIYGTPSIFLEDGRRLSGYSRPAEIVTMLKGEQNLESYPIPLINDEEEDEK